MNIEIHTLGEYLRHIDKIQNSLETYIYRGQSDESWKVVSGVYRRIEESKKRARFATPIVGNEEVLEYLHEKLNEAKKRLTSYQISEIHEINDINILVEMQHYGGATNLIDFSFNSLIALYFASIEHFEVNGRVFCINNSNTYKVLATNKKSLNELFPTPHNKFYSYSPNHSNRRIIKQDSIFIFNDIGHIEESLIDFVFTIKSSAKEKILQELKDLIGITEESIYPDFLGYLQANNARKPFKIRNAQDYFEQAIRLHKKKEYQPAIDYYEKSLMIDTNQPKAYLGITRCLRNLERYTEALQKCLDAKRLDETSFVIWNEMAVINTYLHDYNEAKLSFENAEKLVNNEYEGQVLKNNMAWAYLCFREPAKAKKILLEITNKAQPYHPVINLGHCYLLEKNEEEAIRLYLLCIKNATEDIFWASFDSDYKAIQMSKQGITQKMFQEIKIKIKKMINGSNQ